MLGSVRFSTSSGDEAPLVGFRSLGSFVGSKFPHIGGPRVFTALEGTPGNLAEWSLNICSAQILRKPKGRNDIILVGTYSGVEQHCKSSWASVSDEAFICQRRGILRNPDRWGVHAGHFWPKALFTKGHDR